MNWDKLQVICDVHYWITGFRVFDRSPCCEFDGVQTRSKPEIELWLGWMRKLLQDAQNLRNITGQRGGIVLYRGWKFSDGTWYEWFDYLKVLGQMFRWRVLKLAKCLLPTDAWMVITVKRGGFLPQLHHSRSSSTESLQFLSLLYRHMYFSRYLQPPVDISRFASHLFNI
jgi:hypothetical protein